MESGDKHRYLSHSLLPRRLQRKFFWKRCIFCEVSFGKINAKDVELFRNRSVHEFYHLKALITMEVNTSVVKKKRSFMSKTYVKLRWGGKPVCCCKLSLYAKECGLFWAVIEMTRHIYHVSALFLKSRPLHWFSWIYTRVLNHFRNKSASNAVYKGNILKKRVWMGVLDNTKHFIFWLCNMKQLNFRHFNANSQKLFETNFFPERSKNGSKNANIISFSITRSFWPFYHNYGLFLQRSAK